jgi:hypothetical protein
MKYCYFQFSRIEMFLGTFPLICVQVYTTVWRHKKCIYPSDGFEDDLPF